ncbi:MAG: hypothetical protein LC643_06680, partial [Bacteroidales bacterium]|nr:hypothetical protein [Bacteroidales bacterium]
LMLILLLLFARFNYAQGQFNKTQSAINHSECVDFVSIQGSTNVNEFSFLQLLNERESPIRFHTQEGYITIQIPAHKFEASNPLMYKDFISLIKAKEHPYIAIRFHYNPYELYEKNGQTSAIDSEIYITLAGEEKKYQIPGQIHLCRDKALRIMGDIKINLNDFHLQAPSKFMGMVQVNNEVFVNFGLKMEQNLITKN